MSTFARRVIRGCAIAIPLAALLWVVSLYSFCLRVYWAIGYVPRNKHDRLQAHLENGPHDAIVAYGLIGLGCLFVPWLIAYTITLGEKVVPPRLAYVLPLGWVSLVLVFLIDPGHLFWDVYFD